MSQGCGCNVTPQQPYHQPDCGYQQPQPQQPQRPRGPPKVVPAKPIRCRRNLRSARQGENTVSFSQERNDSYDEHTHYATVHNYHHITNRVFEDVHNHTEEREIIHEANHHEHPKKVLPCEYEDAPAGGCGQGSGGFPQPAPAVDAGCGCSGGGAQDYDHYDVKPKRRGGKKRRSRGY